MLFGDEMLQDFYPGADSKMVLAIRANPPQLAIRHEPQRLTMNTAVRFSLCFEQSTLNEAAARREWTCGWTFGARGETETGWEVFYSFANTDPVHVKVRIKDLDGTLLTEIAPPAPLRIVNDSKTWYALSKETHLELGRLLIVLFLALFGLMATAQQKAQNLTFLEAIAAVIAIGFGAGAIKDMIVQTDQTKKTT